MVYDTIIFILTVAKTWKGRRGISGKRICLVQLMLRDGSPPHFFISVAQFIDLNRPQVLYITRESGFHPEDQRLKLPESSSAMVMANFANIMTYYVSQLSGT